MQFLNDVTVMQSF